jgi:hypothetical protein
MELLWPLLLSLAAGVLLAFGLKCAEHWRSGIVASARSFWCPFEHRRVTVVFEENAIDGRRLAVFRCSAFAPSSAVTCDRGCLTLRRLQRTRPDGTGPSVDLPHR